ncbi:MAG: ABC transporter ATP-binding protein [Candidatus Marinimicrobia bacterium]|nr:ABC transporter ATP-binding protein [Candidatus Neomarinimicrobiota bacterium]MCF7827603.1 ABC transporter ATP-binding protein [Candidatus Neomarinimicrobiota bacterium]MCF7881536.1 ABC transporter ATP-binding protein [Candidatus Neomarinimicrobiota bacterium]
MIHLERVSKQYNSTIAVDKLTLNVNQGELLVLLGTSGCGKTTTLKMINRLIEPDSGAITIDGTPTMDIDVVVLRRQIGYVFQGIGLFPHMTVGENVGIIPKLSGWSDELRNERIRELLDLLNLPPEEFANRKPAQLSGGQQQRIGVARALAARPDIMLMDEPFGALDPLTRVQLQEEYQSIRKQLGVTTVFVTHDMTEALLMGDRIAVMRDGALIQIDTPGEMVNHPADEYVARLMETPKRQADALEQLTHE